MEQGQDVLNAEKDKIYTDRNSDGEKLTAGAELRLSDGKSVSE